MHEEYCICIKPPCCAGYHGTGVSRRLDSQVPEARGGFLHVILAAEDKDWKRGWSSDDAAAVVLDFQTGQGFRSAWRENSSALGNPVRLTIITYAGVRGTPRGARTDKTK